MCILWTVHNLIASNYDAISPMFSVRLWRTPGAWKVQTTPFTELYITREGGPPFVHYSRGGINEKVRQGGTGSGASIMCAKVIEVENEVSDE